MDAADPRHGTYSGSQAHIRTRDPMCDPCHEAHLRYRRRRRYDTALGRPRMIPAQPVIDHLHTLRSLGVTVRDIASRAGVSDSLIDELLNRPRTTIRSDNATALLSTTPPPTPTGHVPALGTIRRIRALARLGWAMRDIVNASNGGVKMETLRRANSQEPETVTVATADAVAAAYRSLCMTLPPARRTTSQVRSRAARKGWATPLAWVDIDDPDERPAEGFRHRSQQAAAVANEYDAAVVDRVLLGDWHHPATRAERIEIVARYKGDHNELARLTGWKVERYLTREDVAS